MRGYADKPGSQGLRFTQIREFREKLQGHPLEYVCRVLGVGTVLDGNGINQFLVLVDESGPGQFVAGQALPNKPRIAPSRHRSARRSVLAGAVILRLVTFWSQKSSSYRGLHRFPL